MLDAVLNFNEGMSRSNILNFGAVDEDDKGILYYYDFDLEFTHYESLIVAIDKIFIPDTQEVKTIRIALLNKETGKALKRYYGPAIKTGVSERYVLEALYKEHLKGISQDEFTEKYKIRLEIIVTNVENIATIDVNELVTNFKFYLKRNKHA